jgi:hypothetical protein
LNFLKLGIWVDDLIIGRCWDIQENCGRRFLRQSRPEAVKVERILWGSTGILRR